ncbi:hypothetical protein HER14_01495 [Acidithiobacillus thiooxidans]|uniref:BRO family protein n=1 Tax=Acidithiobacillus thiooxidans TaxID=930 RepID=UPI001C077BB2|nr:BRO family protein [Acidithiobacillus thiooxidans]MBU2749678.1 hypothetical protein [Acidithiobacillus thiooxidans]
MNIRQRGPAVHIWRIAFQDLEMRTTSSDGVHVWIAQEDVIAALRIPDPAYALGSLATEDKATLTLGQNGHEEGEGEDLSMLNEVAIYEIMARFPTLSADTFKSWLLRLRQYFFELIAYEKDETERDTVTLQ